MPAHTFANGRSAKNDLHTRDVRTNHHSAARPTTSANKELDAILLPCPIQMRLIRPTDATPTTIPRNRTVSTGRLDRFCLIRAIENLSELARDRKETRQRDQGTRKVANRSKIPASVLFNSLPSRPLRRANTNCYRPFDIAPLCSIISLASHFDVLVGLMFFR